MRTRQATRQTLYVFVTLLCACAFLTSCVRQPRRYIFASDAPSNQHAKSENTSALVNFQAAAVNNRVININEASASELEKLPGVGEKLAAEIVKHRERYGRFRRVEHLLMVRGISESRLRQMRGLISVE